MSSSEPSSYLTDTGLVSTSLDGTSLHYKFSSLMLDATHDSWCIVWTYYQKYGILKHPESPWVKKVHPHHKHVVTSTLQSATTSKFESMKLFLVDRPSCHACHVSTQMVESLQCKRMCINRPCLQHCCCGWCYLLSMCHHVQHIGFYTYNRSMAACYGYQLVQKAPLLLFTDLLDIKSNYC